jgi:hypothetical protein
MSCQVCKINHPYTSAHNGITSPVCTTCYNISYVKYKKFKCKYCDKSYNTSEMMVHERFHCKANPDAECNNNKMNECPHCEKSYKLMSSLKGHITNNHTTKTIKNDQIGI